MIEFLVWILFSSGISVYRLLWWRCGDEGLKILISMHAMWQRTREKKKEWREFDVWRCKNFSSTSRWFKCFFSYIFYFIQCFFFHSLSSCTSLMHVAMSSWTLTLIYISCGEKIGNIPMSMNKLFSFINIYTHSFNLSKNKIQLIMRIKNIFKKGK